MIHRGHSRERFDAAEARRGEVGQIEPAHRARDVAERVAALVAVGRGVGRLADAHAVEHDDRRAAHYGASR